MKRNQRHKSTTNELFASGQALDPMSPEFDDVWQPLATQSGSRWTQEPARPAPAIGDASVEVSPIPDARVQPVVPAQQPTWTAPETEPDSAAIREARRREGQVRAELQTLQTELLNVKARYNETIEALEAASQRAGQSRAEFANAMTAISERDAAINHMRLVIANQDREINELQLRLIEAEEARAADASAILESLDKYRP